MDELFSAFPDMHWTVDDMIVEGDKVAVRYTMTGTHKGVLTAIPATNKITISVVGIDRTAGRKFVEGWDRFDTLGLMQQLSVVPKLG